MVVDEGAKELLLLLLLTVRVLPTSNESLQLDRVDLTDHLLLEGLSLLRGRSYWSGRGNRLNRLFSLFFYSSVRLIGWSSSCLTRVFCFLGLLRFGSATVTRTHLLLFGLLFLSVDFGQ